MNDINADNEAPPKLRLPRGIIYGSILICLGIAIIFYNKEYYKTGTVLWFLPFAIIIWGLYKIFKKGFFNFFGQFLVIGGIQLHLVILDVKVAAEYWYPITIIWAGLLFLIKGILLRKKQKEEQEALEAKKALEAEALAKERSQQDESTNMLLVSIEPDYRSNVDEQL